MAKDPASRARAVREPVQVYLAAEDSALLNRLAEDSGLSKAELLRRGVRSLARELGGGSPMLAYLDQIAEGSWPESGAAKDHDALLAESYTGRKGRRR